MPVDISPTTGEKYYSGSWENIRRIVKVLNIDEGKMANLSQEDVNAYQESVDRYIDGILEQVYHVPIRAMNRVQPDGETRRVFPGDLVQAAMYWTAGLLLQSEFQQMSQNMSDQVQGYIENAKQQIHSLRAYDHRMHGQELKSHVSRTLPANMQPARWPEPGV